MEKERFVKGLVYIAVIIILTTTASRLFFGSGETLQEYAQNNPELAYPAVEEDEKNDDASSDNTVDIIDNEETATEGEISPERVTYKDNFYYEPINSAEDISVTSNEASVSSNTDTLISSNDLCYVHVLHYNFDGEVTDGELICNKLIAQDLVEIFYELYISGYRIAKIRPIDEFNGDTGLSMQDNNTFCYNSQIGADTATQSSSHAYGLAVDINPFYNPTVYYNDDGSLRIEPAGSEAYADRQSTFPYKIDENDLCLKLFKEHGFTWGGDFNSNKDYQHFQKIIH